MYLPAEQFVNELISSLRFNRMPDFRERYRNIDVFMVDDIQFLANKERTQEEFFHTFNTLYSSQRRSSCLRTLHLEISPPSRSA